MELPVLAYLARPPRGKLQPVGRGKGMTGRRI